MASDDLAGSCMHQAHALAAATGRGLHEQRESHAASAVGEDGAPRPRRPRPASRPAPAARPRRSTVARAADLVAHGPHRRRGRTDEDHAGRLDRPRRTRRSRRGSRNRGARPPRRSPARQASRMRSMRRYDCRPAAAPPETVRPRGPCARAARCGRRRCRRPRCAHAQLVGRADDANGDLAAVGDEQLADGTARNVRHGHSGMFPCFLGGLLVALRLVHRQRGDEACGRVVRGSITSSR